MRKVVINKCYGGFSISDEAVEWINKKYPGKTVHEYSFRWTARSDDDDDRRDDHRLIDVVESLGDAANGDHAELCIVKLPKRVDRWYVDENDGYETVHEEHWRS